MKTNKLILTGLVCLILFLTTISIGCTDNGESDEENDNDSIPIKNGNGEFEGELEVNFHVQENNTFKYEIYIDSKMATERSNLELGTYTWTRELKPGVYYIELLYQWKEPYGTSSTTESESITIRVDETHSIDWYDFDALIIDDDIEYEEEEPIYE